MKYLHTMIRISNIDESLDFFCDKLGFVVIYRYDSEERKYTNIFLAAKGDAEQVKETKTPLLELTYNWPNEEGIVEEYTDGRNFGHLAYEVDNIYETCQKLMDAGITINRPPRDGRMAFIKSPDGISIELLQQNDPLPLKAPWEAMENTATW